MSLLTILIVELLSVAQGLARTHEANALLIVVHHL